MKFLVSFALYTLYCLVMTMLAVEIVLGLHGL